MASKSPFTPLPERPGASKSPFTPLPERPGASKSPFTPLPERRMASKSSFTPLPRHRRCPARGRERKESARLRAVAVGAALLFCRFPNGSESPDSWRKTSGVPSCAPPWGLVHLRAHRPPYAASPSWGRRVLNSTRPRARGEQSTRCRASCRYRASNCSHRSSRCRQTSCTA